MRRSSSRAAADVEDFERGAVAQARASLDTGAALAKLEALVAFHPDL